MVTAADRLLRQVEAAGNETLVVWGGSNYSGDQLMRAVECASDRLAATDVHVGQTVALVADFSPMAIALLIALIKCNAIVAPLLPSSISRAPQLLDIVDPALVITVTSDDEVVFQQRLPLLNYPHYAILRDQRAPGLVLFTSGSSGAPKGVVHDFSRLLRKFDNPRPAMATVNFLLFDHWGGLNTLLHCLSSGSLVVLPERRTPEYICGLIEAHRLELLPATPSFLNMLLISQAHKRHDLTSLRMITYGAEPMPESTLAAVRLAFPKVELRQTYGLIELGVLRARTRAPNSLWIKLGGEGYDLRVVDNMLQIKADSAMLGYLNAPSPFTEDGYFMTGDWVEVDGEYLRILGRNSDLINVGGQKVFPAEVETVILDCDEVEDCVVYSAKNPLLGHIVCADVKLKSSLDARGAALAIKIHCSRRLEPFKVPVKIRVLPILEQSDRFKRVRINRS